MGAWGYGIRQDDFVCDVIGVFEDLLKSGISIADATKTVHSKFSAELGDTDDGRLFWIALADVQWTYGQLDGHVLQRVKDDIETGRSLISWEEDQKGLSRRRAALDKFVQKIEIANSRPKKRPKVVIREPKFRPGDCLCISLSNGKYGAGLVLAEDHNNVENGENLIAVLDYVSSEKPSIEVFQGRKWLVRTHHNWNNQMDVAWYSHVGFRAAKKRLEIIGRVDVLESDPKDSNSYCGWASIGEQVILQREWDAKVT
jgi:hypothetical protein